MHESHPVFLPPKNADATIWRYMEFKRFEELLSKGALYFCRTDRFNDQFEGSLPLANVAQRQRQPMINRVMLASDGVLGRAIDLEARRVQVTRTHTYANCWHLKEHESYAMWRLYGKGNDSVAIQSTYHRLCESFHRYEKKVFVGLIQYLDYDTQEMPSGNMYYAVMHKRREYVDDNELRAIVTWDQIEVAGDVWTIPKETGVNVRVDLNTLIEKIWVSPNADDTFHDDVVAVSHKIGLKVPIRSSATSKPSF